MDYMDYMGSKYTLDGGYPARLPDKPALSPHCFHIFLFFFFFFLIPATITIVLIQRYQWGSNFLSGLSL